MHARFYAPDITPGIDLVDLPEEEARHLVRVLRLRIGHEVAVFDGRGREYRALVAQAGRAGARVRVVEAIPPAPELAVALTLVQAVLKGDHMDEVVRDAVMMGVAAIQPVVTERTQVSLASLARGRHVERWQRVAVASVKQCGRAVVPVVHQPRAFDDIVRTPGRPDTARLILVEPAARSDETGNAADLRARPRPATAQVLVGPEGGWNAAEIAAAAAAAFVPITIGRRTLRADAVPVAVLAVLCFLWGEL